MTYRAVVVFLVNVWLIILFALVLVLGVVVWALADECNPDLVSALTPNCQLYKPQFRQCRPDQDLDKDMDLLDNLCTLCPPGQCVQGFDGNRNPVCVPCGSCGSTCPPPTVQIGTDDQCGIVCSTNFCEPNPCLNGGGCILSGNGFACVCPCGCTGLLCESCAVTTTTVITTTSTSGTGSTSTSTSTTSTSTTLPLFESVTFMAVPSYPTDEGTQAFSVVANDKMICGRFVAEHSLTAATKMGFRLTTGMALCSTFSAVMLYPDNDAGTKLASCSGFLSAPGVISCTGLTAFSLVRGTSYRICACNQPFDCGANTGVYGAPGWFGNGFAALDNGLSVSVGTAANDCVLGVPTTTGAITQDNSLKPPEAWLSVE